MPPSLRPSCLSALHAAHQGTSTMISKAETSIFWPGITNDIQSTRANCSHCNKMAPSQAALPPIPPILSKYPFQCICADYFNHQGHNYLVIVDRYSNWPIVNKAKDGATGLINTLRRTFATYGIPDELSSDGGPEFVAHNTQQFLWTWGIHHRLSSVAFPHSNCRAEIGVKTIKRLITGNVASSGDLDIDTFQQAILQYRNTPDPATKLSPAMCLFGRPIRDLIPILPGKYHPHPTWKDTLHQREVALRHRHMTHQEKWSEHTKPLQPLRIGDTVRIQNQVGQHPTKWDRTGTVIEVRQYHQYLVRVDGSGRHTLRNRKFLRKYTPTHPSPRPRSILDDLAHLPPALQPTPPLPLPIQVPPTPLDGPPSPAPSLPPASLPPNPPLVPDSVPTSPSVPPLRRSTRLRRPPDRLY